MGGANVLSLDRNVMILEDDFDQAIVIGAVRGLKGSVLEDSLRGWLKTVWPQLTETNKDYVSTQLPPLPPGASRCPRRAGED
jgi:hypothetical protein